MTPPLARPKIVLVHATQLAIAPVATALAEIWPEAEVVSLLDESLAVDRAKTAALTADLSGRIGKWADHAEQVGGDGVLFTCSAFGPAIEAANRSCAIPVLKPNQAMFDDALTQGPRAALLYSFAPAGASMAEEFFEAARARGVAASLEKIFVPDALEALRAGDAARHDKLIAEAASAITRVDSIMLAQFSMARARDAAQAVAGAAVLTSPVAAVTKLKTLITGPKTAFSR